jgi:hypothetical protein
MPVSQIRVIQASDSWNRFIAVVTTLQRSASAKPANVALLAKTHVA